MFSSFDTSGDGQLDRRELGRFLLELMPDMDAGQVGWEPQAQAISLSNMAGRRRPAVLLEWAGRLAAFVLRGGWAAEGQGACNRKQQ